jgi:hypothetical protein
MYFTVYIVQFLTQQRKNSTHVLLKMYLKFTQRPIFNFNPRGKLDPRGEVVPQE